MIPDLPPIEDHAPVEPVRRPAQRRLWALVAVLSIVAVGWLVVRPRISPHQFAGSVIQSNTPAPSVALTSHFDEPVRLSDFEGQVVVMYFGYTFCPDLCPTTLASVDRALDHLGDKADEVQVVMVTVDPDRDSPEALRDYLENFDESFLGLTGSKNDLTRIATVYGVYSEAEDGDSETGYLVNHTASLVVIDREGFLKLVMPPLVGSDELAADLSYLL